MECIEQGGPGVDHAGAHHYGTDHTPEQNPVLVGSGHREIRKDQHPEQHIVDAQGVFNHVPRQEGQSGLRVGEWACGRDPVPADENHAKCDGGGGDPDGNPQQRVFHRAELGCLVHSQVGADQGSDTSEKA